MALRDVLKVARADEKREGTLDLSVLQPNLGRLGVLLRVDQPLHRALELLRSPGTGPPCEPAEHQRTRHQDQRQTDLGRVSGQVDEPLHELAEAAHQLIECLR